MTGGDITRATFDPTRHFTGVRMQQGRVQLDADWNEQADITAYRGRTADRDVIGPSGAPKGAGGFRLVSTADGTDLAIGPGRMYVDGVLCELESGGTAADELADDGVRVGSLVLDGRELAAHDWVALHGESGDPVVVRLSAVDVEERRLSFATDVDTTALTGALRLRRVPTYTSQDDLPDPELTGQPDPSAARVLDLPDGAYLAYLDVWERPVTALEQPAIREIALGGPDTATRTQVVAQVRLAPLATPPDPLDPDADIPEWTDLTAAPGGRMAAFAEAEEPTATPCVLPESGGFQGLENQLYRVQIADVPDGPALLWSRENASVAAAWVQRTGAELTLGTAAPDRERGFVGDGWVELTDDTRELRGGTGTLVQVLKPEGAVLTVREGTATGSLNLADYPRRAKVRRWDSPGPVPLVRDTDIELEHGLHVRFPSGGTYRAGDHWLVPARTGVPDVEWPRDSGGRALAVAPHGIRHGYARLALVVAAGGELTVTDWRAAFPALTELTAADVAYDNSHCDLADTATVQDALDRLCQERDLRFHNRHLHGWGIVCGLAVRCGPNPEGEKRRFVTVEDGYAIAADGADRLLPEPGVPVDVLAEIERLADEGVTVLDDKGDGDVTLRLGLDSAGRTTVVVEKRRPDPDDRSLLDGTLWSDFFADCIGPIREFLGKEFAADPDRPAGPGVQRRAALVNLANQAVNPKTGQQVFISEREDRIIRDFYTGLRELLRSETFCAMFDNARAMPDYPLADLDMDTIFGTGGHARLRLHPAGDQAWTFGPGTSPLRPRAVINRYDLRRGELVAEIDPVAGALRTGGPKLSAKADTGTGAVLDLAFSPDGKRIFVAIASRNEDNTIFRSGTLSDAGVNWGPQVTVCGLKLISLATTAADPNNVYAVALRKVQVQVPAPKGGTQTRFEWHSAGLRVVNPDQIDPSNVPEVPLDPAFAPTGPMVIDASGRAVLAGGLPSTDATSYAKLLRVDLPKRQVAWTVNLPAAGTDGLSFVTSREALTPTGVYAVVKPGATKGIVGFRLTDGDSLTPNPIEVANTAISLAGGGNELLVTEAGSNAVRMVDLSEDSFVEGWTLPTQVGPAAVAVTSNGRAVVLNQVSDTLTVIGAKLLDPRFVFPADRLVAYRVAMLNAYADLLGGFLQYVKDCLFDHFLVRCPEPTGDEKLWLGAVSVRGGQVYKICNFSGRKYVKSFPTLGYWLSLVPLQPLIARAVEWLGCLVLPEQFAKYSAGSGDSTTDLFSLESMLQLVDWSQRADPLGMLDDLRGRATVAAGSAVAAVRSLGPSVSPPGGPRVPASSLIGQSVDAVAAKLQERGVVVRQARYDPRLGLSSLGTVAGMFRTPEPGQEVTLCEEDGTVKFFSVSAPSGGAELARAKEALTEARAELRRRDDAVAALAERLDRLEATLRATSPPAKRTRRSTTESTD